MFLDFDYNEDKLIIRLSGELDHHSAEEVRTKVDDRIEKNSSGKVIMDFSNVTFMDSSGIGVVIGRYKKVSMKKGALCIVNAKESVKRVFELSGLFKIINLYSNIDEALKRI